MRIFQPTITGSAVITGNLEVAQGITGSLFGTASYAITASYALNGGTGGSTDTGSLLVTASVVDNVITFTKGDTSQFSITVATGSVTPAAFPYTGSAEISGSLLVSQGITGSLFGTASWSENAVTASYILNSVSSSFSETASYINPLSQNVELSGSLTVSGSEANFKSNTYTVNVNNSDLISADTTNGVILRDLNQNVILDVDAGIAYDNIQNDPSIDWINRKLYRSNNIAPPLGGSVTIDWENGIFSGSLYGSSSWSNNSISASYALTSSYVVNSALLDNSDRNVFIDTGSNGSSQTINGSLTITQNLTVLGSSSITYITSSQLIIADNIISVNTINPGARFGGLTVIDSGSSPLTSGSLLFDSINNHWIFVHQSDAGSQATSSIFIMGPQSFDNIGNETTLTVNRLVKSTFGDLGEHISDSNITDTGTIVSINSDTEITGSITVTGQINGNVIIPAATLFNYYNFI